MGVTASFSFQETLNMIKPDFRYWGHEWGCRKVSRVWENNNSDDSCRGGWGTVFYDFEDCTCKAKDLWCKQDDKEE